MTVFEQIPVDPDVSTPAPAGHGWLDTVGAVIGWVSDRALIAAAIVVLVAVASLVAGRILRSTRGASRNAKLTIGTAFVQAGVTWVVVTGTYAFCRHVFGLPWWEATAFATFLEAATWVAAGMIYAHAKDEREGFGPAGPFFWLFSILGGLLAVIAGHTSGEMIGRAVVVVFGSCLWYLQLRRVTLRSENPGTLRWTPRRLLVAIGAIEPGDRDVADENREWQVRRLARAMRWANGSWPWSWLGERALVRRGESTREDVIADARRRYAVAHLMVSSVRPDSPVMRRVLADVGGDQNTTPITAPITTPNGHPDAEQITAPDGQANTGQDTTEQPNTEQVPNVRAITSARRVPNGRPNSEAAKNLKAIKRRYPSWRTEMPSARECAAVIGSSPSTGYSYQQKLIAERDAQPADADKEREQVAVS